MQTTILNSCAAAIPLLFSLVFMLTWWDRYFAVTNDGWHFMAAVELLNGKMPYRDFYLFIPPLHVLKDAALISLFGERLIAPQLLGLVERLVLAAALFYWLRSLFSTFAATVSVAVAMALYLSDSTESLSSLHNEAVFFPVMFCILGTLALSRERVRDPLIFSAGIMAGLALLAKQTSGMGATAAGALLFPYLTLRERPWRSGAAFAAGWLVPVAAVCGWLAWNGALGAFVADIFGEGTASKGTPIEMIQRPIALLLDDVYSRRYLAMAIPAALGLVYFATRVSRRRREELPEGLWIAVAGGVVFAGLAVAEWLVKSTAAPIPAFASALPLNVCVLASEYACGLLFLERAAASKDPDRRHVFISGASFAIVFLLSLSWPVYVSMLFPAFPYCAALLFDKLNGWGRSAALAAAFAILVLSCTGKLRTPYQWGGWRESNVTGQVYPLPYAELAGLATSMETGTAIRRVVSAINANSCAGEPIYAYPHVPIFYLLTHRHSPTESIVDVVDTTPDFIAERNAKLLLANPPAVIILFGQTESDLRADENMFRGGRRSGQRSILAALRKLSPEYSSADSFLMPHTGKRIDILRRNGSPCAAHS